MSSFNQYCIWQTFLPHGDLQLEKRKKRTLRHQRKIFICLWLSLFLRSNLWNGKTTNFTPSSNSRKCSAYFVSLTSPHLQKLTNFIVLFSVTVTKHLKKTIQRRESLFWLACSEFSPWSPGSTASRPAVKQNQHGSRVWRHITAARKQREKGGIGGKEAGARYPPQVSPLSRSGLLCPHHLSMMLAPYKSTIGFMYQWS